MGKATLPPPTPTGLRSAAPSGGGEEEEGLGGGLGPAAARTPPGCRESDARGEGVSSKLKGGMQHEDTEL
jgi:hypothetical protein